VRGRRGKARTGRRRDVFLDEVSGASSKQPEIRLGVPSDGRGGTGRTTNAHLAVQALNGALVAQVLDPNQKMPAAPSAVDVEQIIIHGCAESKLVADANLLIWTPVPVRVRRMCNIDVRDSWKELRKPALPRVGVACALLFGRESR
jgi:hypothetical protein